MRFIIAPEWLIKLDDSYKLSSKQVKSIYGYHGDESVKLLLSRGSIPEPEAVTNNPLRLRYSWSVGYIKNFLKLPSEINQEYIKNA